MSDRTTHYMGVRKGWGIDALVLGTLACVAMLGAVTSDYLTSSPSETDIVTVQADVIAEAENESLRPEPFPTQPLEDDMLPPVAEIEPTTVPESAPLVSNGDPVITLMGDTLNENAWYVSRHENSSGFYGADWKRENISNVNDGTALSLKRDATTPQGFTGSEIKSRKIYGYGTYEAVMRPARGSGIVSAFFTYIGPYTGHPHDEIDFEFLGTDLTQVHVNYWRNGKTGESAVIDLGFDAGEAAHLYTFEWREGSIVWKVDGQVIHQTIADDPMVPVTFGQVHFSTWTGRGNMLRWHGPQTFEDGAQSEISCFSFVPLDGDGRTCSEFYLDKIIDESRSVRH